MEQRRDVKALTEAVVAAIDAGRAVERPFFHLEFDRVFPDDIYARMIAAMPATRRPLPGRNNGNLLEDGTRTRVKIDLFPEYIRHLAREKLPVWDPVGRALTSGEVRTAFVRRIAPGLERRFGRNFARVAMYPIPVLTRDIPGYTITPHTDTRWFAVGDNTWHSADPVGDEVATRDSILLTYFVDAGLLRRLRNRGKRIGNFLRSEAKHMVRR